MGRPARRPAQEKNVFFSSVKSIFYVISGKFMLFSVSWTLDTNINVVITSFHNFFSMWYKEAISEMTAHFLLILKINRCHSGKLEIWGVISWSTTGKSCTFVPIATNHSVKLGIWKLICWLTLERNSTLVNNATNHSDKLDIWGIISWSTMEKSCTFAPIAINHSVELQI